MTWFRAALLLAGSSLVLLTGLCLAGIFGAPTDTFNHLWPVWMVFAISLLVVTLLARQLALAATTTICITLLAAIAMDKRDIPHAQGERDIRILSHNLWGSTRAAGGLVHLVDATEPDVIALQEAFNHLNPILDQLESDYPYFSRCRWESTRIYSRFPIHGSGCLRRRPAINPVFGVATPGLDMPSSAWAEIELPNGERFMLGSIHLTWPDPLSSQNEQVEALSQELRRVDPAQLVLVGDFNAAAPARVLETMANRWQVTRLTRHQPTWPATHPIVGIDHAFAGENWARVEIEVGPLTGSDHRPLIIDLARNEHD
ncbi:MAG: endonuclease/exonuclease/phosphatase family protein [Maricaulis sp.]|uniref:endonuclease/exonuclease/phosphatase family protein n=1 Tax=Maricaulis sp. TaxID=1486257 RepID=UPI002626433E|nr:endonuclease/exonuclease/phosphatase family protein [Maricaulis sp.]MDM7983289.1 endonuclease/exonuclease/phosphatase family protein [Maricaulis sp.]